MKRFFTLITFVISVLGFSQNVFDVARKGTIVEMKELVKANKELINEVDSHSFSPLILACYHKNKEVASFLIENVRDVNYVSEQGTALDALCINYDKDLVLKLLQNKANPNIKDNRGVTPLIWAVKLNNLELVKILLENGADKSIVDNFSKTPFQYAIESNNSEIIKILNSN